MRTCTIVTIAALLVGCGSGDTNNGNSNNENRVPACGDGFLDPGEVCDDGTDNSDVRADACRTDCREPYCGDTIIDTGEECDKDTLSETECGRLGFTHGELSCTNGCTLDTSQCGTCGNGEAEGAEGDPRYETCDGSDIRGQDCIDVGQASGVLRCDDDCEWDISGCVGGGPVCGNSVVEANEECDDGNNTACDGCSELCLVETCGNGVVECGEQCDDGNTNAGDNCSPLCNLEACGNGFPDPGEVCDDGNLQFGDGCSGDCQSIETCGNGYVDTIESEECDDASANSDTAPDACRTNCTLADCGDGVIDAGEQCDGTNVGGETCSAYSGGLFNHGWMVCGSTCALSTGCCSVCGDGNCANVLCSNGLVIETHDNCPADCP